MSSTHHTKHAEKHAETILRTFGFCSLADCEKRAEQAEPPVAPKPEKQKRLYFKGKPLADTTLELLTHGVRTYADHALDRNIEGTLYFETHQTPKEPLSISLHALGHASSVADALTIQATRSLLSQLTTHRHRIRVNTIGDVDSKRRYLRELTNFLKRNIQELPETTRTYMKTSVLDALMDLLGREHELGARAPLPIDHLNERSRRHFREVLDYLNMSPDPYEIDPYLLGDYTVHSGMRFTVEYIDDTDTPIDDIPHSVHAGRYDTYTLNNISRLVPAVSAVVTCHDARSIPKPEPLQEFPHSVYLVEIGTIPKMRGLILIDELLRAGIPVTHTAHDSTIAEQLAIANESGARYALILGQYEVLNDELIIRDLETMGQITIPISKLTTKLRSILKTGKVLK